MNVPRKDASYVRRRCAASVSRMRRYGHMFVIAWEYRAVSCESLRPAWRCLSRCEAERYTVEWAMSKTFIWKARRKRSYMYQRSGTCARLVCKTFVRHPKAH